MLWVCETSEDDEDDEILNALTFTFKRSFDCNDVVCERTFNWIPLRERSFID